MGAILTLVNDARLALRKSPIGFINPVIYSTLSDDFNDITSGGYVLFSRHLKVLIIYLFIFNALRNQGCGTKGFTAVPGWDPVTGLGTPDFAKLVTSWLLL